MRRGAGLIRRSVSMLPWGNSGTSWLERFEHRWSASGRVSCRSDPCVRMDNGDCLYLPLNGQCVRPIVLHPWPKYPQRRRQRNSRPRRPGGCHLIGRADCRSLRRVCSHLFSSLWSRSACGFTGVTRVCIRSQATSRATSSRPGRCGFIIQWK